MKIVSRGLLMIVMLGCSFLCSSSSHDNLQRKLNQHLEGVRQKEEMQIQQKQNQIQQRKDARTALLLESVLALDLVGGDRQKLKVIRNQLRRLAWSGDSDDKYIVTALDFITERHSKKCCLFDCVAQDTIRFEASWLQRAINATLKREFERDQQSLQQQEGIPSAPCEPAYFAADAISVCVNLIESADRGFGEKLLPQSSYEEESSRQIFQEGSQRSSDGAGCVVS